MLGLWPSAVTVAQVATRCDQHDWPMRNDDCFKCALERGGVDVA